MKTICETRLTLDRNNEYPWSVQLWYSYDGGKTFVYSGFGKSFKWDQDSKMREYIRSNRSPVREFPLITSERQRLFESQYTGFSAVPMICGYFGRACRVMDKKEGARRNLCIGCPLAEFVHAIELEEWAKS